MNTAEQLKAIRKQKDMSQADFASYLEVPTSTISNIESGARDIPKNLMKSISQKMGIDANWLLTGDGPMFLSGAESEAAREPVETPVRIPVLAQTVSCGPGQEWQEGDSIEEYLEPLALVPSLRGAKVYAFRVRGTSMTGAGINDGDVVLFDASPAQVPQDNVYVFALDGSVYCKLLKFDPISRRIEIYSVHSNDLSKAELLRTLDTSSPDTLNCFHLFGRVLAWMHENRLMYTPGPASPKI